MEMASDMSDPREVETGASGLALRAVEAGDAEAVAALVRAAFAELAARVDPPPSALHETGARVAAHLVAGGAGVVIASTASAEDALLAACLWHPVEGGLHLARLAVCPAHRRKGLALALLDAAESAARAAGQRRLVLQTRLPLVSNRRLFARAGFREVSFHAHPGHLEPTFVEMQRDLDV
jgi:GNAT superfamily N-acetyltransferase